MAPVRTFEEWEATVPTCVKADTLWNTKAYRLAFFVAYLAWHDCCKLLAHPLGRPMAEQLIRSSGSISANITEGYSRSGNRERAHFYEFALGSARESRDHYLQAREVLREPVVEHRLALITQIVRLLTTMVQTARHEHRRPRGQSGPPPSTD